MCPCSESEFSSSYSREARVLPYAAKNTAYFSKIMLYFIFLLKLLPLLQPTQLEDSMMEPFILKTILFVERRIRAENMQSLYFEICMCA